MPSGVSSTGQHRPAAWHLAKVPSPRRSFCSSDRTRRAGGPIAVTARSGRPSPLKSPLVMPPGASATSDRVSGRRRSVPGRWRCATATRLFSLSTTASRAALSPFRSTATTAEPAAADVDRVRRAEPAAGQRRQDQSRRRRRRRRSGRAAHRRRRRPTPPPTGRCRPRCPPRPADARRRGCAGPPRSGRRRRPASRRPRRASRRRSCRRAPAPAARRRRRSVRAPPKPPVPSPSRTLTSPLRALLATMSSVSSPSRSPSASRFGAVPTAVGRARRRRCGRRCRGARSTASSLAVGDDQVELAVAVDVDAARCPAARHRSGSCRAA